MAQRTRLYEEGLIERLRDPEEAIAYLNAHLEDDGEGDVDAILLVALGDVARAFGVRDLAEKAGLGRESLYKTLSSGGNPKLSTLLSLLNAMGFRLEITHKSLAPRDAVRNRKVLGFDDRNPRKGSREAPRETRVA